MRRRGSGARRVVSRGRIGVDAAKAMSKLREHLLVDLHHYTLEIVRAAVASGAKTIDLSFDADDVMITWNGRAIARAALAQLLDHVLTEAKTDETQRLRLLAVGVNAALGLDPAYVELYSVSPGGKRCTRVRWKPEMLKASVEQAPRPSQQNVPIPAHMGPGSLRVQLRRHLGWAVLRRAATGGTPAEVVALANATRDLSVSMTLNGEVWPRPRHPAVVLRVPLDLPAEVGDTVRFARLELLESLSIGASALERPGIDLLERGVRLVRYAFEPEEFPSDPYVGVGLPIRIVVDVDRLPTNASRSAVREDSALLSEVVRASQEAFRVALKTLCSVHSGMQDAPPTVWVSKDRDALDSALGACISVVVGARREGRRLSPLAHRVLGRPLFRNACGQPCGFVSLEPASGEKLAVYAGEEALDAGLSPWLEQVMWPMGSVVECVMRGVTTMPADELVALARDKQNRRQRFMDHTPTDVAVPASAAHLVCEAFEASDEQFAGLVGEVAVKAVQRAREGSTIRVFHQRREVAVLQLAARDCALPLDVAIAWDEHIQVRETYDGVEDTAAYRQALWYAMRVAVMAVADLSRQLTDMSLPEASRQRIRAAVRCAIEVAATGPGRLGARAEQGFPLEDSGLMVAAAWPTTRRGHFVSLVSVREMVALHGAYFVVAAGVRGRALHGRIVLALSARDRAWLTVVLGDGVAVPYERGVASAGEMLDRRWSGLDKAMESAAMAPRTDMAPRMRFERENVFGIIAVASESRLYVAHAGHILSRNVHPAAFGPVSIAIDDALATPNGDWTGLSSSGTSWRAEVVERDLLATCVAAAGGDAASLSKLGVSDERSQALVSYLLHSASAMTQRLSRVVAPPGIPPGIPPSADELELADLHERLVALPLFMMLDEAGQEQPAGIADVQRHHPSPGAVPVLLHPPNFPTYGWHPVVARRGEDLGALRDWLGARLVPAEDELAGRRELAVRESRRQALFRGESVDPWDLGELGSHGPVVTRYTCDAVTVAAALPSHRAPRGEAIVDLLLMGRLVARFRMQALPVVARVAIEDATWLDASLRQLTDEGERQVVAHVDRAAMMLVVEVLSLNRRGDLASMLRPTLAGLCAAAVRRQELDKPWRALRRALRYEARWPKVQGGYTALGLCIAQKARKQVPLGTVRYLEWASGPRKSRLDQPILYLPPGTLGEDFKGILRGLQLTLRNVTRPVAQLQTRRSAGEESMPTLAGLAATPELRATVASLRLSGLEGEVEIKEGYPSWVSLTDLEGTRSFDVALGCAVKAALLVDAPRTAATNADIESKLGKAVSLLFARAHNRLDTLPLWVRSAYRGHVMHKLITTGTLYKRDERAAIFRDTAGDWHDLEALRAQEEVWVATVSPPYPEHALAQPILALSAAELEVMRQHLDVIDKTGLVSRAQVAVTRLAAEPRAVMELPQEVGDRCVRRKRVEQGGIVGEVGLLQSDAASAAGVFLHVGGRPLCQLELDGWPVVAVIDDAAAEPNAYFDGLATPAQARAVLSRVRVVVAELFSDHTQSPADALCTYDIPSGDGASPIVAGRFWLPAKLTAAPTVRVDLHGLLGGTHRAPLHRLPSPSANMSSVIPVSGHVAVVAKVTDRLNETLAKEALVAATTMLSELGEHASSPWLDAYRWNLALLGEDVGMKLCARTTEGAVDQHAVLDALARGHVWWTAERGSVAGHFPGDPPAFILRDGPDEVLLRVLRLRAPIALREIGGLHAPLKPPRPDRHASQSAPRAPRLSPPVPPPAARRVAPVESSWLSGLTRRVVSLFRELPEPAVATFGFAHGLRKTIADLEFVDDPVSGVAFARSGRPLRWRGSDQQIVVHRDHPSVLALVPTEVDEPSDEALAALAAAAMSELNRAYASVTAAEEKHAMLLLARSLS